MPAADGHRLGSCQACGLLNLLRRCSPTAGRSQVLSGQLVATELPEIVERTEMADLVNTYGKTIHTWQIDRGDKLPFGAAHARQIDMLLSCHRDATYQHLFLYICSC